jgi:hypothetical protein
MSETINIAQLKEEFAGKSNHQAYELAFSKRMMRPHPAIEGGFLGNSQRQQFLPQLKELIRSAPGASRILDVGAGKGEIVNLAFDQLPDGTISLIEPNPLLLKEYRQRLATQPNLKEGTVHCGVLEDFYNQGALAESWDGQHVVLAIHMLYHFTNMRAETFSPVEDLERAISTMYGMLAPSGKLFIVFADQMVSTTGLAGRFYFSKIGRSEVTERLKQTAQARLKLLQTGAIVNALNRKFPDSAAAFEVTRTNSCIFGNDETDIVAMCVTAEIGEINDQPFDCNKLEICAEFVNENRNLIGLTVESDDTARIGMTRSNQPQVITVITRN